MDTESSTTEGNLPLPVCGVTAFEEFWGYDVLCALLRAAAGFAALFII